MVVDLPARVYLRQYLVVVFNILRRRALCHPPQAAERRVSLIHNIGEEPLSLGDEERTPDQNVFW